MQEELPVMHNSEKIRIKKDTVGSDDTASMNKEGVT
jgi:hypothetical protein